MSTGGLQQTTGSKTKQTEEDNAAASAVTQTIDSLQTVGNVKIANSTSVHIGNITNLNGTIEFIRTDAGTQDRCGKNFNGHSSSGKAENGDMPTLKVCRKFLNIIPRSSWLAQRPMKPPDALVRKPVEFVVVSNTATEDSEKRAANVRIVRDIQCLHIESRGLNDIAYNFLVGCDGNVYEGRGWDVVGAHTNGYNTRSLGISFIGGFMRTPPTKAALNACQLFLKSAVRDGYLAVDYKLIGQCQCSSTESPGRVLFEVLQTWKHFYKIEDECEDDDD